MTPPPRMDVTSVTIGAPDPRALAAFYARMLNCPVAVEEPARPGFPPEDGWAQLRPRDGSIGPKLSFEYEARYTPPAWPSEAGRQHITAHLDIAVTDLDAAVAWGRPGGRRPGQLPAARARPGNARPGRPSVLPVSRLSGTPGRNSFDAPGMEGGTAPRLAGLVWRL